MAAKHRYRRPSRHPNLVAAIGGAALGVLGVGAYTAVADDTGRVATPASAAPAPVAQEAQEYVAPQAQAHVQTEGTVVSISDSTLTTRDAAGSMYHYVITPRTTSVTPQGSGPVPTSFAVGDVVSIHATVTGDAAVATAVADGSVTNLQGPPMDSIDPNLAV